MFKGINSEISKNLRHMDKHIDISQVDDFNDFNEQQKY